MSNKSVRYVKLLRADLDHNGFKYKEGLNVLDEPFNSHMEEGGGLYFCKESDIYKWIAFYKDSLGFIADVTLCPDSTYIETAHKVKTDKFILGPFRPFTVDQWIHS